MAVELTHLDGGVVVTIHDPAELPLLGRMASTVGGADAAVVLDVSNLTITPHSGAELLVDAVRSISAPSTGWSLVATRLTARRALRQLFAGSDVRVYPSISMAIAAMDRVTDAMSALQHDRADGATPAPDAFDRLAVSEDTLVQTLTRLRADGFVGEFVLEPDDIPPGLCCKSCGRRHLPERTMISAVHRFEGPSSPEDEALLLALVCPRCGARGTVVTAYGPLAAPEEAELLAALAVQTDLQRPQT
jgi:hypothetical protein